jgi:2-haloacid dehalogenase
MIHASLCSGDVFSVENDARDRTRMIKVILFDTFGTIADWRSSIARESEDLALSKGLSNFDGDGFARAWRAGYAPGMARVTAGKEPFVSIDFIHRQRLDEILPDFGLAMLTEDERSHLNLAWHRLTPWSDSLLGLRRIKTKFMISPLSNGSLTLLATMAKRAGLPWDFIFSSDMHRAFKPDPAVYQNAARLLNLEPNNIMMAAAHNADLEAARNEGMRTAYINRPTEYGVDQKADFAATSDWDLITSSVEDLAHQLGCGP